MNKEEPRKKMSKEEKDKLMAQMVAAAKGRVCFPESLAESKRVVELALKGKLPPSFAS